MSGKDSFLEDENGHKNLLMKSSLSLAQTWICKFASEGLAYIFYSILSMFYGSRARAGLLSCQR